MKAPTISDLCKSYIRSLLSGRFRSAFEGLSILEDPELFLGLAAVAREDMDNLFDKGVSPPVAFSSDIEGVGAVMPQSKWAASMGGKVGSRMSQMNFAYKVVKNGKVQFERGAEPPTPAAGAAARDYVHKCVALKQLPLEINEDLTDTLPSRSSNTAALNDTDFTNAATTLGVDVPAMKAVAQVESAGSGFGATGCPIIRYELHRFQKKTHRHFQQTHPYLSQSTLAAGGPYHNGSQDREYTLLFNAMMLQRDGTRTIDAAIESTSWGRFQVMGENWSALGWSSAVAFAKDMYLSEAGQLSAFVKFVKVNGLTPALKAHKWAEFAKGYNGPSFADNSYDTKLASAFARFKK